MIRAEVIHLGKTIGKLRGACGMSRKELAEAAGISESRLKKIEAAHRYFLRKEDWSCQKKKRSSHTLTMALISLALTSESLKAFC